MSVTNTGIAPFYYDWPVELGFLDAAGTGLITRPTAWRLTTILPGEPSGAWRYRAAASELPAGKHRVLVRVPNPMPGGRPLRFANQDQDRDLDAWLTLVAIHQ